MHFQLSSMPLNEIKVWGFASLARRAIMSAMLRRLVACAAAAIVGVSVAGCTGSPTASTPSQRPSQDGTPGQRARPSNSTSVSTGDCAVRPTSSVNGFLEIHGRSSGQVTLFGLSFAGYAVPAQQEVKIVWRMTGSGSPKFAAVGPSGSRVDPTWGPERHLGSNWNRPGDEWGTGFRFPKPGCWTVRVDRGAAVATAGILVAAEGSGQP